MVNSVIVVGRLAVETDLPSSSEVGGSDPGPYEQKLIVAY